jgi:hypothetical protein
MLVQKLARYIHSLHNSTTNMWNVNLWKKDILQVLFQYSAGGSVTSVVTMDLSAEDRGKIFGAVKDFFRVQSVQTDSGPTQPPMKWLPGVLNPPRQGGWSVELTTGCHLVATEWNSTSIPRNTFVAYKGTNSLCISTYVVLITSILLRR